MKFLLSGTFLSLQILDCLLLRPNRCFLKFNKCNLLPTASYLFSNFHIVSIFLYAYICLYMCTGLVSIFNTSEVLDLQG